MNLKVISFNIRHADDPNGHSAAERAPRLYDTIHSYNADVVGLQEVRPRWEPYLENYFASEYEIFNKYRTSVVNEQESAPILWKKNKFECLKTGYFWLSDTPEVESKGWDEVFDCHRMCEYVVLLEKNSKTIFTFMNTHFGFGDKCQQLSANLIYEYSKKISNYPTFLTGDFNMVPQSQGYNEMVSYFRDVNAITIKTDMPTYHGYNSDNKKQAHIDYCFVDELIVPKKYEIIRKTYDGKFASDHYGLYVELEI